MKFLEIHLEVSNVEQSLALYSKLLPHKKIVTWQNGDVGALVLNDGSALGCWKADVLGIHKGRGGKHIHFAFKISSEEYDEYLERIVSCGLEPLEHVWETGDKSVYFFDHDGHQGEFITADWITLEGLDR